jgi:hypothetical protein
MNEANCWSKKNQGGGGGGGAPAKAGRRPRALLPLPVPPSSPCGRLSDADGPPSGDRGKESAVVSKGLGCADAVLMLGGTSGVRSEGAAGLVMRR